MYVTAFINVNDVQRRRNEKISSSVNACQSSSNMQASKQRASLDYSELKKKFLTYITNAKKFIRHVFL